MATTATSAASSVTAAASQLVVVLGAGPGLGFSCAQAFARRGHPVALLSRSLPRLQALAATINQENGDPQRATPYAVDATRRGDLERAMRQIVQDGQARNVRLHTAIHNPGGQFMMKPFLETTEDDVRACYEAQASAFFHFGQAFLRALQEQPSWTERDAASPDAVGNLFVTGATASTRGGAKLSAFAASCHALRAVAQSVAREYGPQGVHVAHFIIDGIIETERTSGMLGDKFAPNSRMDPAAIADVYYHTAQQPRSVWAFETDLRPSVEKW